MSSYFYRLSIPKALADEKRELFSSWLVRLGEKWNFQGIEDWQIDLRANEKVLGIETEFHDLAGKGKKTEEVLIYFSKKSDAQGFKKILSMIFQDLKISPLRELKKIDWMRDWRKHYKTQKIQSNNHEVYIVPAWKKKPKTKKPVVKIYPGQAFGTGTHETTKLCIQRILDLSDQWITKNKISIMDFGAGTGILSLVASSIFSSTQIIAVESDSVALDQAKKNIRLNKANIRVSKKTPKNKKFHLILANVLSPVLLAYEPYFYEALKPEGCILLSGILQKESLSFFKKFNKEKRWKLTHKKHEKEWSVLTVELL